MLRRLLPLLVASLVLCGLTPAARAADWRNGFVLEMWFNTPLTSLGDMNWSTPADTVVWDGYPRVPNEFSGVWPSNFREIQDYVLRHTGQIEVLPGEEGLYDFRLGSHDGSRVYINGDLIIDNDGDHNNIWVQAQLDLPAGRHTFEVQHYSNDNSHWLDFQWSLPPGPDPGDGTPWPPAPTWAYIPGVQRWGDYSRVPVMNASRKTYYLRTTGNDANDGLHSSRAFRTLAHACAQMRPGDVLYIGKGTYEGPMSFPVTGDYYNRLYIRGDIWGYTGDRATDSSEVIIEADGTALDLTDTSYVDIYYLTFDGRGEDPPVYVASGATNAWIWHTTLRNGGAGGLLDASSGAVLQLESVNFEDSAGDGVTVRDANVHINSDRAELNWFRRINGAAIRLTDAKAWNWAYYYEFSNCGDGIVNQAGRNWTGGSLMTDIPGDALRLDGGVHIHTRHQTITDVGRAAVCNSGTLYLLNSIVSGTSGTALVRTAGNLDERGNLLWDWAGSSPISGTTLAFGNLIGDPLFVGGGDYRPQPGSPAIDAGDRWNEIGGTLDFVTRPIGPRYDLGCYEIADAAQTTATLPYTTDFSTTPGLEWNQRNVVTLTSGEQIAGFYGYSDTPDNAAFDRREALTINVETVPGREYAILFDLWILDTWDGESFRVLANGTEIFREAFRATADHKGYEGDYTSYGQLNAYSGGADQLHPKAVARFTASTAVTQIAFTSTLDQTRWDESWGIDNLTIMDRQDAEDIFPYFLPAARFTSFAGRVSSSLEAGTATHWADVDADGDLDAIVTGNTGAALLRNNGSLGFTATTLSGGNAAFSGGFVDLDGDGDADFVTARGVSTSTPVVLFNNGSGGFSATTLSGMGNVSPGVTLVPADLNRDGLADLLGASASGATPRLNCGVATGQTLPTVNQETSTACWGDLISSDFTSTRGLSVSADVNLDGRPDFYSANGDGTLLLSDADESYRAITGFNMQHEDGKTPGTVFADYDNDGDMDLFIPDRRDGGGRQSRLFRNDGDGVFTDVTSAAGILPGGGKVSADFGDYDNDGDLDLFVAGRSGGSLLYRNEGDGTFVVHDANATLTGNAADAAFVDADNDGDLDLACTRGSNEGMMFFMNRCDTDNYLKVRVLGRGLGGTNSLGIGTTVELYDAGGVLVGMRQVGGGRGHGSGPLWLHFGGVNPDAAYTIRVRFQNAVVDVPVTPRLAATTIGSRTIPQMLTLDEAVLAPGSRVVAYQEIDPLRDDVDDLSFTGCECPTFATAPTP